MANREAPSHQVTRDGVRVNLPPGAECVSREYAVGLWSASATEQQHVVAATVCASCPVRVQCGEWARDARPLVVGVYGDPAEPGAILYPPRRSPDAQPWRIRPYVKGTYRPLERAGYVKRDAPAHGTVARARSVTTPCLDGPDESLCPACQAALALYWAQRPSERSRRPHQWPA